MDANKPANAESGEGHNQPEETGAKHDISISDSLQERFRTLMDSDASVKEEDKGHKPFIGQLPMLLRKKTKLKKYFQPLIMSIGPVHYHKNELKQGQQYKSQLTKLFIQKSRQSKEIPYNNILKETKSFKEFYDHQDLLKNFNGDYRELAWMFFVDGCALIQFVCSYVEYRFHDMNIATKEDVAELQKAGILFSHLPNDQEVKTFRELNSSLKPYPVIFYNTKQELVRYFNDKNSMTTGK